MNTFQLPLEEYNKMLQTIQILKDNVLLKKIDNLIDVMYETKYGLFMNDYSDDLTEYSIKSGWNDEPSPWDKV
ncbi:MAG: hypothetical protein HW421_686 [Ignavibacteria bacterium]|nr:hypothetical protein [Ignavibacteria bacterium]